MDRPAVNTENFSRLSARLITWWRDRNDQEVVGSRFLLFPYGSPEEGCQVLPLTAIPDKCLVLSQISAWTTAKEAPRPLDVAQVESSFWQVHGGT